MDNHTQAPARTFQSATTNDEAHGSAQTAGPLDQLAHTDSASSDGDRKAIATLRAVAALRGVRVDPIESDGGALVWIVTRWNLTRQCNTFSELRTFLKQMGIEA